MFEAADVAPSDGVVGGVEVVVAERLQARQHGVDLGFLGHEGVQCGFMVSARLLGAQLVAGRGLRVQAGHLGVSFRCIVCCHQLRSAGPAYPV